MSKLPLVSVGIPAYNRPNTLGDTLKSIINQSYQNIEIIISDNCSSDIEVSKIINKFIEKDSRIHYFKQSKNIGASANFKFVKEKASGEYFMWASDDDIWDKSYIEEGMKVLLTHKEYNAWFCTIENIDSFNRTIRKYKGFSRFSSTSNKWIDIIKYGLEPEILGKANLIYSIYEIESLEKVMNKYFINEKWGSDYCFNLAYLIDNNVFVSNKVLLKKRIERDIDNSESLTPINIKYPLFHLFPFSKSIEYMKENYFASKNTKYYLVVLVIIFLKSLFSFCNYIYMKLKKKIIGLKL